MKKLTVSFSNLFLMPTASPKDLGLVFERLFVIFLFLPCKSTLFIANRKTYRLPFLGGARI